MKYSTNTTNRGGEVPIRATLWRTAVLVGLTVLFAACVRAVPVLGHGVQRIAGSELWQKLYSWLGVGTSLGREQLILTGIMIACFFMALLVQAGALILWNRLRR